MIRRNEQGFTLPELIVTTVGFIVLFGLAALLLAPSTHTSEKLDARRRLDVAATVQAVNRYIADAGKLPPDVPDTPVVIGTSDEEYDLCFGLAGKYLPAMPLDPQLGVRLAQDDTTERGGSADCDDLDVEYSAGYTIVRHGDAVVVATAFTDGRPFTLRSQPAD